MWHVACVMCMSHVHVACCCEVRGSTSCELHGPSCELCVPKVNDDALIAAVNAERLGWTAGVTEYYAGRPLLELPLMDARFVWLSLRTACNLEHVACRLQLVACRL